MPSVEAPSQEGRRAEIVEMIRSKQKELDEALELNIPGEEKQKILQRIMGEITRLQNEI